MHWAKAGEIHADVDQKGYHCNGKERLQGLEYVERKCWHCAVTFGYKRES